VTAGLGNGNNTQHKAVVGAPSAAFTLRRTWDANTCLVRAVSISSVGGVWVLGGGGVEVSRGTVLQCPSSDMTSGANP
jgi:hypothetical protein